MVKINDKDDLITKITKFLEEFQITADNEHKAHIFLTLADNYYDLKRFEQAVNLYKEALRIYKKLAEENVVYLRLVAGTLYGLGRLYHYLERHAEAENAYKEAIYSYKKLAEYNPEEYLLFVADAQYNLGNIYQILGKHLEAEDIFLETLKMYYRLSEQRPEAYLINIANIQYSLGSLYYKLKKFGESIKSSRNALEIFSQKAGQNPEDTDYQLKVAEALKNIGLTYLNVGNTYEALENSQKALSEFDKLGNLEGRIEALKIITEVFRGRGDINNALKYSQEALSTYLRMGSASGQASTLTTIGSIFEDKGNLHEALNYYEESLQISKELGREDYELENNIEDIRRELSEVYFSVYTSASLSPGINFILYVWAYILEQKTDMSQMARMEEEYKERGLKGPVTAKIGDVFNIVLILPPPLEALKKIETITWKGKITNVTFPVSVPKNMPFGSHLGRVQIYIDGFIKLDIEFILEIGASKTEMKDVTKKTRKINKYFASYSSEDRIEVMKRVQGVKAGRPEVEVFVDCLSMHPGEDWESRIYEEILKSDVLLLFWTLQAKHSEWVTKEWTYALNNRGLHFIQPFPLEDPKNAKPPKELMSLHFHDRYIIIIKGLEN